MSSNRWPTATKDRPCPTCGHSDRCRVAPDGTAAVCWRNGGKVQQFGGRTSAIVSGTGYVGQAHLRTSAKPVKAYTEAQAAIEAAGKMIRGRSVAAWTYRDAAGGEVFRVVRYALPDGDKQYRPIHWAKDGWRIGDPSGPLPLYRLNELPAAGTVWVTEGEKAADAARTIGLAATASAHGAGSAGKSNWTPLAGRHVCILPDNDEQGRKYAEDVARLLAKLTPPAAVKIVTLPGLPQKGDVVEYISGRGDMTTDAIRGEIELLAGKTPELNTAELIGGPVLTCLADVEPSEIRWLWPGRVALGRLTLLVGRPGEGKSFLTTDMAARITTGTPWPDGSECPQGSVIFISAEDDPGDTIRPRLDAHHADCRKVHLLSAVRRVSEDGNARDVMFTLADVAALETALKAHPDCKLIVVDPIGSFLGGDTDSHRDNEVRSVLAPVAKLAEKYGPAVLVVAHRRKGAGSNADEMALGSRAFTGIARAVWHLSRDAENKDRRLLLPGKNNLAPEGDGLAFTIGGGPPAIAWEREPVAMSADDALAVENGGESGAKPGPEPEARRAAADWLRKLLACGEVEAGKVKAEATSAGLAWRTVQRAADELGVIREKNSFSAGWQWRLPKTATGASQTSHVPSEHEILASWHLRENRTHNGHPDHGCNEDATSPELGTFGMPDGNGRERGEL